MLSENIYNIIDINPHSATPKYLQLYNSIIKAIHERRLENMYPLPSINELSFELEISRDTAEKAYKQLKKSGAITSVPGKGYFISMDNSEQPLKLFLLFNKLSIHKKIIYDSMVKALGQHALIDFYIYNNDFSLFKKLLQQQKNDYSYYVIIPHFNEGGENAHELINQIPKDKLIILDKLIPNIDGKYGAVYENFADNIYKALCDAKEKLSKYDTIKIVFPSYTYHPKEILKGFLEFTRQYAFEHEIIRDISKETIEPKTVYISLMEEDLVYIIKKIKEAGLNIGEDVGVISYNEIPLKEFILNGITTISSDFKKMGEEVANMILAKSTQHIEAPFYLTLRNSL